MRTALKLCTLAVLCAVIGGCVSPYTIEESEANQAYKHHWSRAKNIMDLFYWPDKTLQDSKYVAPPSGADTVASAVAVGTTTALVSSAFGGNSGSGVALGFLAAGLKAYSNQYNPLRFTQFMAYLPEDAAKDRVDAAQKIRDRYMSALVKVYKEAGYTVVRGDEPANDTFSRDYIFLAKEGTGCKLPKDTTGLKGDVTAEATCKIDVYYYKDGAGKGIWFTDHNQFAVVPDWLGLPYKYGWQLYNSQIGWRWWQPDASLKSIVFDDFWEKIGLEMKDGLYLYRIDEEKKINYVVENGKALLFVAPD